MPTASTPKTRVRHPRKSIKLRRLHRWLGLGAACFLILLSVTGVALNHASSLGLDTRRVAAGWLLDWYGLEAPPPSASFTAGSTTVTLIGERLFIGPRPARGGVSELRGAIAHDDVVIVATADSLLVFSPSADLLDVVRLGASLPAPIAALGRSADGALLVVRTGAGQALLDATTLEIVDRERAYASMIWSQPAVVSGDVMDQIERDYRGDGVTFERLLYDVHSGRILAVAGVTLMDLVGVLLIILSITGLVIWLR